jgi:hypothetical protein
MKYDQLSSMISSSGTDRVCSATAVLPANGCFSPVDRVSSWIRERLGALFKRIDVKIDRQTLEEDCQTYFLKLSIVTSKSWDGSMLKSRTAKLNLSVHCRLGMPRIRDDNCTNSITSRSMLCAQTLP